LDEEKSDHASQAQENGFGSAFSHNLLSEAGKMHSKA
jgi:hypothetical protein